MNFYEAILKYEKPVEDMPFRAWFFEGSIPTTMFTGNGSTFDETQFM